MRTDGYAPIGEYAAIGDGRTCALVASDGSIDWLCVPDLDSESWFAGLLDVERGGRFALEPAEPFETERRYVPGTNVLEIVFRTDGGAVRVVDALTLPGGGLEPLREVARRIEGLAGSVRVRWAVEPRFGYGRRAARVSRRGDRWVLAAGGEAASVSVWGGEAAVAVGAVEGVLELREGDRALLALTTAVGEPLVFPSRAEVERRLDATIEFWRQWSGRCSYDGPWRDAVVRSALAMKLLVYAPSGAIAAAPTTSLPEEVGGARNFDYRYSWVRDSSFVVDALLELGYDQEAESFLWWLMHASQRGHPELKVLYRLNGDLDAPERTLELEGYRGSRPVRIGNLASDQLQLGIYGSLLESVALYVHRGNRLDPDTGRRLADAANWVCENWRRRDSGIWEVRSEPRHFTHSKLMCWVALDRVLRLSEEGQVPRGDAEHWREQGRAIADFVDGRCWSEKRRSYVRWEGADELDSALLMAAFVGSPDAERAAATVEAVRRELADGPFVHRYLGEDGLPGGEGAFLACSFWLAHALARVGRSDEGAELMERLLGLANDVGLYAEEVDPGSGELLGNFPQALTHLALVNAAAALAEEGG